MIKEEITSESQHPLASWSRKVVVNEAVGENGISFPPNPEGPQVVTFSPMKQRRTSVESKVSLLVVHSRDEEGVM